MDNNVEYFPTKSYRRAVLLIRSVLLREKERLEALAHENARSEGISPENLFSEIPRIVRFSRSYEEAFDRYLEAVLPQHRSGVRCGAGCGNCCHHFPMSVEPFELVRFYFEIRRSPELLSVLEKCHFRSRTYRDLFSAARAEGADDPDDVALIRYFGHGFSCPFILPSKSCGVYAFRPVTCRMYFSETPGKYCVPEYLQTDLNRSFIVYLPDEVEELIADISAHYASLSLPESLYEGVVAMNAFESDFARAEEPFKPEGKAE